MSDAVGQRSASASPQSSEHLAGVAVYTMFRGDPTQLLQWCNFHLNAGAARLYLVLDCPGRELVASLPEDPRIHGEVMDQRTWDSLYPPASQNVERKQVDGFWWMARRAAADGHDHLAFVDADELISLAEPFTDIAGRFPDAAAITVPVREMWYSAADPTSDPFGATLALRGSSARGVDWGRLFGWRAQFLRNGLLGHDAGKSIYRLPMAAGDISVHRPRTGAAAAMTVELPASSGAILHFDSGSVSTWNAKWSARLQGSTVATGLGPHRQAQQGLFAYALRQAPQQQKTFFGEFFSLDRQAQRLLGAAGLLEHVDVREGISGPLPVISARDDGAGDALVRLPDAADRVKFQFALVCDKRFVKPTFATMTSVLAHMGHHGSVRFIVLGDGLHADDVSHLRALEHTAFDVQVVVHDITADLDRDVGTEDKKRATFGRIYLIDYLPEQRTIYLDGDVLATRDFTELFELDLGTACLAGAPDSAALRLDANPAGVPVEQRNRLVGITEGDPLEYLNGGVLILALDNPDFRTFALKSRALVVMQGRALKQRDQDAMNIAFAGRKYRLDSRYNYMTQFYVSDRCLDGDLVQRKYDAADASLIHFSGKIKPWEAPEAEFYNGLYRRLVAHAEERVGVSCKLYFSRPEPSPRHEWTAARWAEVLESRSRWRARADVPEQVADITFVDLCDTGVYLKLSSQMYELAVAADLRLTARAGGKTLFEIPIDRTGPQQAHLSERVGRRVRKLSFDVAGALAPCGGVARHVELAVTPPAPRAQEGFVRSVGMVDVLAAGPSAVPDLLREAGVDGAMESLSDGWVSGWYRPRVKRSGEAVSLYIDGELVAMRRPNLQRPDRPEDDDTRGFKFNIANLLRLGYATSSGAVSVRVSGANIPLRGAPLTVVDVEQDLRYDAVREVWVKEPTQRHTLVERVRRRLKKA
jgi:lipopolysaccharide biosynthesis glycosyltransferase